MHVFYRFVKSDFFREIGTGRAIKSSRGLRVILKKRFLDGFFVQFFTHKIPLAKRSFLLFANEGILQIGLFSLNCP